MSIVRVKNKRRRGFTLVEIVLAVAILALMSLAIYRFVQANIVAQRVSTDVSMADSRYMALRDLLATQLQGLPPGVGALIGEPLKLNDRSRDELTWTCGAGPGLLTRYAPGDFKVTLRLRPQDKNNDRFDLGLERKSTREENAVETTENWTPLIENVQMMEIHYFDPRINTWTDRWTDTVTLPRLVKITIGRADAAALWEAIIPLARTPL
jgi:prepilin-type N-terminal cleavage/methylation domain-containing protein